MNKVKKSISCPNCQTILDVDELLISQFEDSIRLDLQSELKRREDNLQKKKDEVNALVKNLEDEKDNLDKLVEDRLNSREESLKEHIKKQIEEEKSLQLEELENELKSKSEQLIELNQTKAKLQRLSREFEEKEAQIHLKMEEKLTKKLDEAKSKMKEESKLESELAINEKQNIIDSLKKKLQEASQRASQSSMQRQGEAFEITISEVLQRHKSDLIEDIKVGARGADLIQKVRLSNSPVEIGSILYECKSVLKWSDSFVKKIKSDNLSTKCDLMVIVTSGALPKGCESTYMLKDSVWITTYDHVFDLSVLLRYALIKSHSVLSTQTNRKEKMSLIYDYLTSQDFKATFESMLDSYKNLQDALHSEQQKLQLLWKKRERYLSDALSSAVEFYGSIKSISEHSIPTIPMLEIAKAS